MSRIDRRIGEGDGSPIDAADIIAALGRECEGRQRQRSDAVVRYLSGSDGWREASEALGGAFAADSKASGLVKRP